MQITVRGPRTDPWGTPEDKGDRGEEDSHFNIKMYVSEVGVHPVQD